MMSLFYILNLMILPFTSYASNATKRAYGSATLCPTTSQCRCYINTEGLLSAYCTEKLDKFPSSLPSNLSVLNIYCRTEVDSNNRPLIDSKWFTSIPASAFKPLPHLEELMITRCPVVTFPQFLFANLSRLRAVTLNSLLIKNMDKTLFQGSYGLRTLHLMKMADLETVDPGLLVNQNSLTTLVIKQTSLNGLTVQKLLNPIKKSLRDLTWTSSVIPITIPSRTFYGFRLRTLSIIQNKLTSANFLIFTKVRVLKLKGNPGLATTPPFDFSRCEQLNYMIELDLSFSNLRLIPNRSLRHMQRLRKLYLGSNLLETVPYDIYNTQLKDQLIALDLSNNQIQVLPTTMSIFLSNPRVQIMINGNPIHCNCEAKWLLKYSKKLEGLRCGSGPLSRTDFKGKLLTTIPASQLVCRKPSKPIITANNMIQRRSGWRSRISKFMAVKSTSNGVSKEELIRYEDGRNTIKISRGQKIALRCVSSGDPAPQLYWIFPWNVTLKREAPKDRTIFSNEISVTITQDQLKHYSIANFTCVAQNSLGHLSESVFLKNLHPVISTLKPIRPGIDLQVTASPSRGNGASFTMPSITLLLFPWTFLMQSVFEFSQCFSTV